MVIIRVPATTANLGPGFDTLGLALNLFQEISIEKSESNEKKVIWHGETILELADNFVLIALERALSLYDRQTIGYTLTMLKSDIPISRGLGSSAAAIVAGIYAANYLMDYSMSKQIMLDLATKLEGHPDNVVPAMLGNMIIATTIEGVTHYSSIDFPQNLALHVFIPDFKLNTAYARKVLPASYTRAQCIHNISRVSFLIHSMLTENYENLKLAFSDEIHEPFRYPLIEDSNLITEQLTSSDTFGFFISGAGPTLMALTKRGQELNLRLNTEHFKHRWHSITLEVNKSGAIYEIVKEIT